MERCPTLLPSPNWAPASAGVVVGSGRAILLPLPGEGRGPGGEVGVTERCPRLLPFPNWAPAFAGVVGGAGAVTS